jgi:hypothetical protein
MTVSLEIGLIIQKSLGGQKTARSDSGRDSQETPNRLWNGKDIT